MKEVVWQNKYLSVVDEKIADVHILKIFDIGFVKDGTYLQYNEITKQMWWHFGTENYHLSPVEISVIKNAIRQCPNEEMFDFSNYTNNICHCWCVYLKDVNCPIGNILADHMPWPFVIAIIKLLLEEIYDEG